MAVSLPRATPESVGVPSGAILNLIDRLQDKGLPMHSVLVIRNGKLVSETHWKPFGPDFMHRMYSTSKSFVSLAIGLMVDEGKISLDDTVVSHFPEYVTGNEHEYIKRATIRHMLMMADCHTYGHYTFEDTNWVKTWFDNAPNHPSGSVFMYNTCCTNICCAIVEKISGMTFLEYMYPRLLGPIGVSKDIWCIKSPEGYSFGGSGVICTAEDMAKVSLLLMQGGEWDGKQLLSREYVQAATSCQIDNTLTNNSIFRQQGYGYQIWRTRHNGFGFSGMGSQLSICLPDQDLLVVTTADTQGFLADAYEIHQAIFDELMCELSDGAIEPVKADVDRLGSLNGNVEIPIVKGNATSAMAQKVSGKTYALDDADLHISSIRFEFEGDTVKMHYEKPNGKHTLVFGIGKLVEQEFPETHYSGTQIRVPMGKGYRCHATAAWADDKTLLARLYATDIYFGSFEMNATFIGDEITVLMTKTAEDFFHDYQGIAAGKVK